MLEREPDPLHRFPVFHTSSTEVLREKGAQVFGVSSIELRKPDRFDTRANFVQLQDIALVYAAINCDIALQFPGSDFVSLQIGRSGSATTTAGGLTTEVNGRQACVTSVGLASTMRCAGGNRRLGLRVKGSALDQMLHSVLGFKPKGALTFAPAMPLDDPKVQGLLQMVMFLAKQLDSTSAVLPPLVLHELEQAITVAMLCAGQHSFSHLLESHARHASNAAVHRAEEFIQANWDRPIRIDDLVALTEVSARSLCKAFRQTRGYSPIAFAKMVRLNQARQMLDGANPDISVTGVAFKCGFGNLGHFAADYKRAFGELPSETLAMQRPRRRLM
jgi:AraC-like DNA-binding protein